MPDCTPATGSPTADLLAFLAVLAVGVILICTAHVSPDALAAVAVGLGALFAGWAGYRPGPHPGAPDAGQGAAAE
jgi:hypothetical protein